MLRDVFAALAPFKPTLVGTQPLGIHAPDGGVRMICEAEPAVLEHVARLTLAQRPDFDVRSVAGVPPAVIVSFTVDGTAFEIFGQAVPTVEQQAFRFMLVEARVLRLANAAFRDDIVVRMRAGAATEAAFAGALGLAGDPGDAILALDGASDAELAAVVAKAGVGLRASAPAPVARAVASPAAAAPVVVASTAAAPAPAPAANDPWSRHFTKANPNPRLSDDEFDAQHDTLRTELGLSDKHDIAHRVKLKPEHLRLTNPVTEFGLPKPFLSFYRWCNGGEFEVGDRRFAPILKLHEIRNYLMRYGIPHYMPTCILFALDGKGNCYLLDLSTKPTPWVRFGPLDKIEQRDKFRLLADNFEAIFLDPTDPSEW
jgi:hypothetical protein